MLPVNDPDFAARLRILADSRGLNASALGRHLGLGTQSRQAPQRWLAGKTKPRKSAGEIAAAFGITVAELFGPMRELRRVAKASAARVAKRAS